MMTRNSELGSDRDSDSENNIIMLVLLEQARLPPSVPVGT
jgi:hypothetical protein